MIPDLIVMTDRLDDFVPKRFLDIIIKKPSACTEYNHLKDDGTDNDKNLIIDSSDFLPEVIELQGTRVVLDKNNPWFNEVKPHHPIVGGKIDPFTGKNTPAIFFCFDS